MPTPYSQDRVAWAEEQGRLLRARRLQDIDWRNVADEVAQLGSEDHQVVQQRIRILLTALLRWAYQPDLRSIALLSTIGAQRSRIGSTLKDSAGLAARIHGWIIDAYPEAKELAVLESGLFDESFPESLPFLPVEVVDEDFLPDPFGDDDASRTTRRSVARKSVSL